MSKQTPKYYLAFDKNWFNKNQRALLWLLNSRFTKKIFRWVLRIHKDCPDKTIINLSPNSYTVFNRFIKGRTELTTDFRTHPKFSKRVYFTFKPLWWVIHLWDWAIADRFIPQLSYGFTVLTQYPATNGVSNPVDGVVTRFLNSDTFANTRNGVGTTNDYGSASVLAIGVFCGAASNQYTEIDRLIACFDTSSITSTPTISSATLSLFEPNSGNTQMQIGDENIVVCAGVPASTTALANADYQNAFGTVDWGHITTPVTKNAYNDIPLNATGIANISKTAITKLGVRFNQDITGTPLTWISNKFNAMQVSLSNTSGTSQDEKLTVNYSVPGMGGNTLGLMGIG